MRRLQRAVVALCVSLSAGLLQAASFTQLVAFGDSLTDIGAYAPASKRK